MEEKEKKECGGQCLGYMVVVEPLVSLAQQHGSIKRFLDALWGVMKLES